jgi:hypothetical protein
MLRQAHDEERAQEGLLLLQLTLSGSATKYDKLAVPMQQSANESEFIVICS